MLTPHFKTREQERARQPQVGKYPPVGPRIPVRISRLTNKLINQRGTGRISRHAMAKGIQTNVDYTVIPSSNNKGTLGGRTGGSNFNSFKPLTQSSAGAGQNNQTQLPAAIPAFMEN